MKFNDCRILTDENIQTEVVRHFRDEGFDVVDINEESLQGASDVDILTKAFDEDRVVVTHDSDFGTLAVLAGQQTTGILYLRPGHIDPPSRCNQSMPSSTTIRK